MKTAPRLVLRKLTPKWMMANGRDIDMPRPRRRRELSTDWDNTRLRCWPRLSTARTEVIVAQSMCSVMAVVALAILSAAQVLQ